MQINISTDYAIRILLYLSQNGGRAGSDEISQAIGVAPQYMVKVLSRLRGAQLVGSISGPGGGYYLKKPISEIAIKTVYDTMEQSMAINRCMEEDAFCSRNAQLICPVRRFYIALQKHLDQEWFSLTLQEIIDRF